MDFGETYAPVGKRTTFLYLISLIGRYSWNMDPFDVVTAFLNPDINDDNIYMTLPERWQDHLNVPKIIARLWKAHYSLKQAPRVWHDDIYTFLLCLGFTQSSSDRNLYLRSDGILILVYVDNISISYPKAATKAVIVVRAKLSEKYKITKNGPACQLLSNGDSPQRYLGHSRTEIQYHHIRQTIHHGAYSRCLDAHGS